jgi:asparagine synthase (glutamine-hydrolysing)
VGPIGVDVLRAADLSRELHLPIGDQAATSLVGYLCAAGSANSAGEAEANFVELAGRKADLVASTASYRAHVVPSAWDTVGENAARTVQVVLHGEIYNTSENQAVWLAERFAEHGFDWAKNIHGSFALLVIDKTRDRVAVITDRLNTRRIFASENRGGICISTQLSDQRSKSFNLDMCGVASHIVNRVVYNSRTLYRGISILKRGCIHELTRHGFESKEYWQFGFASTPRRINRDEMVAELRSLLIQAVGRRLHDNPDVFLSLSAGYDSSAILGALAFDHGVPGVQCFSYDHGPPPPNSDAALARELAACAKYPHEVVETYDGNFVEHILDNAEVCLARHLCWYCADFGAWRHMVPRFASVRRPVVFVGEQTLGWERFTLTDYRDVLASLQIYGDESVSWLFPLLPADSQQKLREGLDEDLEQIRTVAIRETHGDLYNANDYLNLDQRHVHLHLPWRQACVPLGVGVRSPLFDNDILDFITRVPKAWRMTRRLFKETITGMYPQLFSIPRCSTLSNFYLNLTQEFTANAGEVRNLIDSTSSRLDLLIPPDVLQRLLADIAAGKAPDGGNGDQTTSAPGVVQRLSRRVYRRFVPSMPPISRMKPADVLLRLITLRTALASRD